MKTREFTPYQAISRPAICLAVALALAAGPGLANETTAPEASADSSMALEGGQDGTVFKSLTIEGENRVKITFERPNLALDIDPSLAPGLALGNSMDVLNRTITDLDTPLLETSPHFRSPHQVRPWLTAYETGPVATFKFDLESVHRWTLLVVDSRGQEITQFQGKKNPPREIPWDGRGQDGSPAKPGLTYSYVLEAFDKAGNRRRFVGEGFQLQAYRRDHDGGQEFMISGAQWKKAAAQTRPVPSAYLLETASWINLKTGTGDPVLIRATAGTYAEAQALGDAVAKELRPLIPGDEVRVAVSAVAEPGAPGEGILHILAGSPAETE
ncbi:MAG: hypothetical protein ABFS42_08090 [Candidatus Krumholzibacteriota bacterium]